MLGQMNYVYIVSVWPRVLLRLLKELIKLSRAPELKDWQNADNDTKCDNIAAINTAALQGTYSHDEPLPILW